METIDIYEKRLRALEAQVYILRALVGWEAHRHFNDHTIFEIQATNIHRNPDLESRDSPSYLLTTHDYEKLNNGGRQA